MVEEAEQEREGWLYVGDTEARDPAGVEEERWG